MLLKLCPICNTFFSSSAATCSSDSVLIYVFLIWACISCISLYPAYSITPRLTTFQKSYYFCATYACYTPMRSNILWHRNTRLASQNLANNCIRACVYHASVCFNCLYLKAFITAAFIFSENRSITLQTYFWHARTLLFILLYWNVSHLMFVPIARLFESFEEGTFSGQLTGLFAEPNHYRKTFFLFTVLNFSLQLHCGQDIYVFSSIKIFLSKNISSMLCIQHNIFDDIMVLVPRLNHDLLVWA